MNLRSRSYYYLNSILAHTLRSPQYLILFLSDQCPNNCSHCWYDDEWKQSNISGKSLTIQELEKISKSIPFLEFLSMTGGEAFLRDEIVDIVDVFNQNTKVHRFDIPTSGFNPEMIESKTEKILRVLKNKPFRVDISFDGLVDTHNKIRRNPNAFNNAIETIHRLKKLRNKYSNFDLSIITTISEQNADEIESFSEFINSIFPDGEWMVNLARPKDNSISASTKVIDAYIKANEIIDKRIAQNRFKGDRGHIIGRILTAKNVVRRNAIIDIACNKRTGGGCSAGTLAGVIALDGEVRACESIEKSLGNIRDYNYNLPDLWKGKKAFEFRKEIQQNQCICTHECFLSVSLLIQPSGLFNILNTMTKI